MHILGRYVFRQVAGAVVLILLSLTSMIWITVVLRQLELMTSQGQSFWLFLKLTTLALPTLMAIIAPIALLLATLQMLNRLAGDSELIIMTAGGASTWAMFRPLALIALVVTVAVGLANHVVAPWSQRQIRDIATQVRTDLISQVIQPGRFTSPEANLTIHIAGRSPTGDLLGLVMHDARDEKQASTYLAERGIIIKQDKAAYLLMERGHIIQRPVPAPVPAGTAATAPAPAPRIITFDKYAFDINPLDNKAGATADLRPRERFTLELLDPNPDDIYYKHDPGVFRSELHDRMANVLYPFAFVLLALAFAGQATTTRQSNVQGVVAGASIGIAVRGGGIWASNVASVKPFGVLLQYGFPLATILVAGLLISLNMRPRRRSRFGLAVTRRLRALVGRPRPPTATNPSLALRALPGAGRP